MLLLHVAFLCVCANAAEHQPSGVGCARKAQRSACTDAAAFLRGSSMYTSHLYWDSQACLAHLCSHTAPRILRVFALAPGTSAYTLCRWRRSAAQGMPRWRRAAATRRISGPGRPAPGAPLLATGLSVMAAAPPSGPQVPSPGK